MIAAALLSLVVAAVPGIPEPQPGDTGEGGVLLTWGNDVFSRPNPDDHRTNYVGLWARTCGFHFVADNAMLTDREVRTRTDEWTATLGYQVMPELVVGLGYRARGDGGGEFIQNMAHEVVGANKVRGYDYDPESAAVVAYGSYIESVREGGVGYDTITSALVSTDGDLAFDQAARGVVTWRWLSLWAGSRFQWRETPDSAGPARRHVDDIERGLWVEGGIRLGYLTFESRYHPEHGVASGAMTLYIGF